VAEKRLQPCSTQIIPYNNRS